jgi:hypothetical protein
MRRVLVLFAFVLVVGVLPARAAANQCQGPPATSNFCEPDLRLPADDLDPPANDPVTTGYIGYPSGGYYPAYSFSGHYTANDPGRFGNAFTFDGTDNDGLIYDPGASGDDRDRLSPEEPTLAAWVKATNPGSNRYIIVRGTRGCGPGAWGFVTGPNGGLQFMATDLFGQETQQTPEVPAASIWDGSWHAIAGVFDGYPGSRNVISLWIDGKEAAAADMLYTPKHQIEYGSPVDSTDVLIARTTDSDRAGCQIRQRGFAGSIDEVELFHKPLTATQIAALQDASATAPPDVPFTPDIQGPTMTGTPKVGQPLVCTDHDSLGNPTYTWERAPRGTHFENDQAWFPIAGASGANYTVQDADAGSIVRCHEYGTVAQNSTDFNVDRASSSLRTDADVPQNQSLPHVTGQPVAGNTLNCYPGTWSNGPDPSDYEYQWLKNGAAVATGDEAHGGNHYTLSHTYTGSPPKLTNATGDAGNVITCRVYAKNDIGYGPGATSPDLEYAVDGGAYPVVFPTVTATRGAPDDFDPVHSILHCNVGSWRDDYARLGVPGYTYSYQWYRVFGNPPAQSAIAGATDADYHPRAEDLGRDIRCRVTVPNTAGTVSVFSTLARVGLPSGPVDSTVFREPGRNGADPTSLLALNNNYVGPIEKQVVDHLNAGLATARTDCRNGVGLPKGASIPGSAPAPGSVPYTPSGSGLDPVLRCQILLHSPSSDLYVGYDTGVRFHKPGCVPTVAGTTNLQGQVIHQLCPSLGIEIPAVNPTHPPTGNNLGDLAGVQPKLIIWDLDGDGTADAICPGTAPVLRTILDPGEWKPRAVIVTDETLKSGTYHFANIGFDNSTHYPAPDGIVRKNQVRVCSTSFDPPPDPASAPCVTRADFGQVHLEGNLCPVSVRALDAQDYEDLLGDPHFAQLKAFMLAASEDELKNENGVTQTESLHKPPSVVTWARWAASSPRDVPSDTAKTVAATNANTQAALSALNTPLGYDAPQLPHVDNVPGLVDAKNAFAFQQVLVSRAPVGINGITQNPIAGTGMLLVPSDVKNTIPNQDQMVLAGRDVASHLGLPDNPDGIPLATGGLLKSQLSDVPTNANDVIRATNLDDVQNQLQGQADQLRGDAKQHIEDLLKSFDLGPFKLVGGAQIHAKDDGSATIEASVKLPGLAASPDPKNSLVINATLNAGLDGHIALRGLHLHQNDAYLGPLHLQNLGLDYDSNQGLTITGAVNFSGSGINIVKFQLGPDGQFLSLIVDFNSSPGIPIGPGVFLTTLGGGFDLPKQSIDAHAVVAAGPAAGGCALASFDGRANVFFGSPFSVAASVGVRIVCIPIGGVDVYVDGTGLFKVNAHANLDLGPLYLYAALGGAIQGGHDVLWQVTADGGGGIRDLLSGQVHAVLSNAGLAGCGEVKFEVPLIGKFISLFSSHPKHVYIDLAGGASLDFIHGLPPISLPVILDNLHLFTGCDISAYRTVTHAITPRGVTAGGYAFTVARNAGASLFSIEGAGATPLVKLRSPSGQVFDLTHATAGQSFGHAAWGKIVASENRTVVLVGEPAAGTWTAETASGAPAVVRVRQASILPKPAVQARVTGKGTQRTLTYSVAKVSGQEVQFVEQAKRGYQVLKRVHTGGSGHFRFTPAEASGTKRTILAQVFQDGHPRASLTVAHFVAPSPRVGRVAKVSVRRKGSKAIVTWSAAYYARIYLVSVRYGDGRNVPLFPKGSARHVTVTSLGKGVGLRVSVRGVSPQKRLGPQSTGTLAGNMHVGRVRYLPKPKRKPKPTKKKTTAK